MIFRSVDGFHSCRLQYRICVGVDKAINIDVVGCVKHNNGGGVNRLSCVNNWAIQWSSYVHNRPHDRHSICLSGLSDLAISICLSQYAEGFEVGVPFGVT